MFVIHLGCPLALIQNQINQINENGVCFCNEAAALLLLDEPESTGLSLNALHLCLSGKDTFKVKISSQDKNEHLRVHVPPPLDRGDGSFLVRYRLYGTALRGLTVQVLHQDAAVAKSPYTVPGLCCAMHYKHRHTFTEGL